MSVLDKNHRQTQGQVESGDGYLKLHLSAGTYDHALYGYHCTITRSKASSEGVCACSLTKSFVLEAHSAPVTAAAADGRFVVTGSVDELIRVLDVQKNVELGILQLHKGTITALEIFQGAIMLSGAEDGIICIWDTKDWTNLKLLKGHKGGITSIAVHPTGKLALSLGKDRTLRVWNLVKGRCAFTATCAQIGDIVIWSPDGKSYAIISNSKVEIFALEDNKLLCSFESAVRVCAAAFLNAQYLAFGGYAPVLYIVDVTTATVVTSFNAHESRIKCMAPGARDPETGTALILVTADSNGIIKVWSCEELIAFDGKKPKTSTVYLKDTSMNDNQSHLPSDNLHVANSARDSNDAVNTETNTDHNQVSHDMINANMDSNVQDKETAVVSRSFDKMDDDDDEEEDDDETIVPLAATNTLSRITCLVINMPQSSKALRTAMAEVRKRVRMELLQSISGIKSDSSEKGGSTPKQPRSAQTLKILRDRIAQREEIVAKKMKKGKYQNDIEIVPLNQSSVPQVNGEQVSKISYKMKPDNEKKIRQPSSESKKNLKMQRRSNKRRNRKNDDFEVVPVESEVSHSHDNQKPRSKTKVRHQRKPTSKAA